jgi:hypothetical protein
MLAESPLSAGARARRELLAGPDRSNDDIAALTGVSRATVQRIRQRLNGAGLAPGRPGSRMPVPVIFALPRMPEAMAEGLCVRHLRPDLWSSSVHADRAEAIRVCQLCPALAACREWSLNVPARDRGIIWGGMTVQARAKLRRQREAG